MSHDTRDTTTPGTLTIDDRGDEATSPAPADPRVAREHALLLHDLATGIVGLDFQGNCTFINPAARSYLGIRAEDGVGRSLLDLVEDERLHKHIEDAIDMGKDGCPVTRDFQDGERVVEMCSRISNDLDRLSAVVLTLNDVTWRNEINERKDQFLSLVSHELRTPLTVIRGYLDVFERGVMGELTDTQKDCSNMMLEQCEKLDGLIRDLIRFRDLSRGVLNAPSEPVVISSLFRHAQEELRAAVEKAGMRLTMATTDDEMACWCNSEYLSTVLRHLVDNAIKFARSGGYVHIQAMRFNLADLPNVTRRIIPCDPPTHTQWMLIRVSDRGPGFPAEALAGAFTPFVQGEPHLTRQSRGLGLGLPVVREIIDRSGGTIWVDSSGTGTRVSFILPLIHKSDRGV